MWLANASYMAPSNFKGVRKEQFSMGLERVGAK